MTLYQMFFGAIQDCVEFSTESDIGQQNVKIP